jgi:NADPH-dependent F420 reductase
MSNELIITIAILGGTGKEGKGLAFRWAKAGYKILIGSRELQKATATADELKALLSSDFPIEGADNLSAAEQADIVVLTVPYAAHRQTLENVKGVL